MKARFFGRMRKEPTKFKEKKAMLMKDTVELMLSDNCNDMLKAEYWQTKIRYDRLHVMTIKYEAGVLEFEPKCSLELLNEQKRQMGLYLHALEVRAAIEGVDL